jgi:hypothetical protein
MDPKLCNGEPVIKGTRISDKTIFAKGRHKKNIKSYQNIAFKKRKMDIYFQITSQPRTYFKK